MSWKIIKRVGNTRQTKKVFESIRIEACESLTDEQEIANEYKAGYTQFTEKIRQ